MGYTIEPGTVIDGTGALRCYGATLKDASCHLPFLTVEEPVRRVFLSVHHLTIQRCL
jgi:hypothetical protein